MPRKLSLKRADFAKTRSFERRIAASLSVSFGDIPERPKPGGAIIVPKKAARSAVERNRIKRALRPLLVRYLRYTKRSILVTVRKKISSRDLRAELEELLEKIPLST